jgi:ATP-dependent RNA helicase DDX1
VEQTINPKSPAFDTMSAFEELGVMPAIIDSLSEMGWHLYRPVQSECVPLILGGGDVAVAAETGAGKTGAFCIPILQTVYETLHAPPLDPKAVAATEAAAFAVPIALSASDRSRNLAIDGYARCCSWPLVLCSTPR